MVRGAHELMNLPRAVPLGDGARGRDEPEPDAASWTCRQRGLITALRRLLLAHEPESEADRPG